MNPVMTAAVTVSDEAAARVAELALRGEYERMVEQALRIPGLRRLRITLAPAYDAGDDPRVLLDAICDGAYEDAAGSAETAYGAWKVRTFLPEVSRHFCLLTAYE